MFEKRSEKQMTANGLGVQLLGYYFTCPFKINGHLYDKVKIIVSSEFHLL